MREASIRGGLPAAAAPDGMIWLPLFACLRRSSYPDRRAAKAYRVEAHFSGLRRRVFGVKWSDPPAFRISDRHSAKAGRYVHSQTALDQNW